MANDSKKVLAGKPLATGGVWAGPSTATAPTDASAALTGFNALGYIGDDGLTEATERSTDKVKAWGGDTVKVLQTDFAVTYSFSFIESTNTDVLKAVYGAANVTTTAATVSTGTLNAIEINSETLPRQSYVFEVRDGDARIRIYVPEGQITEVGEVTYSDEDVIAYEVTIEAFVDENGNNAYKYVDDGIKAAA